MQIQSQNSDLKSHLSESKTQWLSSQSQLLKFESHISESKSQIASSEPMGIDADDPLREAFTNFVGTTFFGELIKAYRSTQKPSAYFHGGRAEEIFQGQLDQTLADNLTERTAHSIADPMFELFMQGRQ